MSDPKLSAYSERAIAEFELAVLDVDNGLRKDCDEERAALRARMAELEFVRENLRAEVARLCDVNRSLESKVAELEAANKRLERREYFAASALQGTMAGVENPDFEICARIAVEAADALIAALDDSQAESAKE